MHAEAFRNRHACDFIKISSGDKYHLNSKFYFLRKLTKRITQGQARLVTLQLI